MTCCDRWQSTNNNYRMKNLFVVGDASKHFLDIKLMGKKPKTVTKHLFSEEDNIVKKEKWLWDKKWFSEISRILLDWT